MSEAAPSVYINGGTTYDWNTVKVGAGGFVTGIESSDDGLLKLVRTDVYGGYKLSGAVWSQVVTNLSMPSGVIHPENNKGVYSFAVSPSGNTRAYMYFNDVVYVTSDAAVTWTATPLTASANPNSNTRLINDKMAVHPVNPDLLLVGVPNDGLHYTSNGGGSFTKATGIPDGGAVGPSSITFDHNNPATVYASIQSDGLYRSTDSGATWARLSGGPSNINDVEVASNGTIYVASGDVKSVHVWKYTTSWLDISAATNGWWSRSIAVDPNDPDTVFVLAESGDLVYTNDGGSTWTSTNGSKTRTATDIPWLAWTDESYMSAAELMFDPVDSDKLWFAQGIGVWTTSASSVGASVAWTSISEGIEELVTNDIIAPPGLNRRTMAAWDRPLFSSNDSSVYPATHGPNNEFNNAWDVDWSASNPSYQVALVSDRVASRGPLNPSYSTDAGQTWSSFPTTPTGTTDGLVWGLGGSIAVGDPGNVVIIPAQCTNSCGSRAPHYTTDGGATWTPTSGLPADNNLFSWYYLRRTNLTADRVNAGTFYAYHAANGVYRSTDNGANWTNMGPAATASGVYNLTMKSVPGQAGHLFLTAGHQAAGGVNGVGGGEPFYRSTDGGATWSSVNAGLEEVYAFGFGKAATGQSYPSVYVAGWLSGAYGIYRSGDQGVTWEQVGDYPNNRLDRPVSIDGDKDIYGCVYIGYSGSGWAEGCPASINNAPTDIAFSATTIAENNNMDTMISSQTTTDADSGDTHTYTLSCSTPGPDDGKFQIITTVGSHLGHLHSNAVFDYESPADLGGTAGDNVYHVCVRSTDNGSPSPLFYDKTVFITVTDVSDSGSNNAPTDIALSGSLQIQESQLTGANIGTFSSVDADSSSFSYQLVNGVGGEDNSKFTLAGPGNGQLTFNIAPDYENPTDLGGTANNNTYALRVRTTDDGSPAMSFEESFIVTVLNDNSDDTDMDNISKSVEDSAPNNGDYNGDSLPDSAQSNVATRPNTGAQSGRVQTNANAPIATENNPSRYMSLLTPLGTTITEFNTVAESSQSAQDKNYEYPLGLFDFTVTSSSLGSTELITFYLDQEYPSSATDAWSWRKYNANDGEYTDVPGSANLAYSTATIGGQVVTTVTYSVVDGGVMDQDGTANGVIIDPIGPAVEASELATTGTSVLLIVIVGAVIAESALVVHFARRREVVIEL